MKQQMTCLSIQPQNDTLHNYVYTITHTISVSHRRSRRWKQLQGELNTLLPTASHT